MKLAEAEAAHAEALERDPENGWWRLNHGLIYKHRGRWNEGAALFEQVRELVGNEKPVLCNLGGLDDSLDRDVILESRRSRILN